MEIMTDTSHILLDSKCAANGNSFCFRSMDEVLESGLLQGGTKDNPIILYIAPGVYWMHDPGEDGPIPPRNEKGLPCEKTIRFGWLKIIGLSDEPGQVVLASRKGQSFGCIGNYTMFSFEGEGLWVQNLTFGNYCNVDLEYPWEPALSCPKRSAAITQAQLAYFNGRELLAENCRFISRLNLLPICGADYSIYKNCHFECTDDSLNGHAVYEDCDFDFYGGCPFWKTDRAGVIFRKCLFRVHTHRLQMAKHEGQMALVDCNFVFDEAVQDQDINTIQKQQTELRQMQQAKTIQEQYAEISNKELRVYEMGNTWNGKPFSLNRLGLKAEVLPQAFLHWEKECPVNLEIRANTVNLAWDEESEIDTSVISFFGKEILDEVVYFEVFPKEASGEPRFKLLPIDSRHCRLRNCNQGIEAVDVTIHAHTAGELKDEIMIKLLPQCNEIPHFISYPTIRQEGGSFIAEYRLDIPAEQDDSLIIWYRLTESADKEVFGKDAIKDNSEIYGSGKRIAVARGRGSDAAKYTPDMDDVGCLLYAEVCAAGCYGEMGDSCGTEAYQVLPEDVLYKNRKETDFRFTPLEHKEGKGIFIFNDYTPAAAEIPPEWRMRGENLPGQPWSYGKLGGGCVGSGLYPMQQGSSIIYEPSVEEKRNMRAEVVVDTAKTAGQGFGSAGQYMDIILSFEPAGQGMAGCGSGLAVRLKRTVRASDGVEFGLVKYENGVTFPLTEPVIVSCFQTGCRILAEAADDSFRAEIGCTSPQSDVQKQKGWLHQAGLSVSLPQSEGRRASGFCLLHTGTCGDKGWFNTIMLHQIRIWYE